MSGSASYKVVETMVVTDQEIERLLNEMGAQGWLLDGIHFVTRESSKRPGMAFLVFISAAGGSHPDSGDVPSSG